MQYIKKFHHFQSFFSQLFLSQRQPYKCTYWKGRSRYYKISYRVNECAKLGKKREKKSLFNIFDFLIKLMCFSNDLFIYSVGDGSSKPSVSRESRSRKAAEKVPKKEDPESLVSIVGTRAIPIGEPKTKEESSRIRQSIIDDNDWSDSRFDVFFVLSLLKLNQRPFCCCCCENLSLQIVFMRISIKDQIHVMV